jgi:cell division protease FtsH
MYWHKKMKLFLSLHWIKIAIVLALVVLVVLSIWGLMTLESFYMHLTLAQMPMQILLSIISAGIFVYMYMIVFRGGFAKLERGRVKGEDVKVHFDDVIGIDEAKEEAWEVVNLITDRARLQRIGGKILRGLLMVGPPGCGKTYLAKAIATEAGVPFIAMAGSEFVEIFVGVGASRVRKLFKQARQLAYAHGACILFIDELDAIGRARSFSYMGGGMETNATLNQILVEMDGLTDKQQNVIVIGATNAAEDVMDPALLRPGRFDRKIYIDKPGLDGREKLFKYYLAKVKHDPNIDVNRLAKRSVYKSPADIDNIIKESALIATRHKNELVTYKDISEAIERVDLGMKRKRILTPTEKRNTAYHEAGHLIVMYVLHPTNDVFKASIVSRRYSLGVVYSQPREELYSHNREKLLADIKVSIAGYVAEKLKCGSTSEGVSSDFKNAMGIAHSMVWRLGMSEKGYLGDYTVIPDGQLSERIKEDLHHETQKIFHTCIKDVEDLLKKESAILDRFAKELVEKEELEYDEIEAIFAEYGKTGDNPAKNSVK